MYEHERREENFEVPMTVNRVDGVGDANRVGPEWAERATMARQQEWSSDREVDPGDTHDKGEASLCVGEAA